MKRIGALLAALACLGVCNGCAYLARASETPQNVSPPADYDEPALSDNGRYVAFGTYAVLDAGDTNDRFDVFVRDNQNGAVVRVSVATNGATGNNASRDAVISGDGRFVAFESQATNFAAGDTNGTWDVFLHDRDTDEDGVFDEPGATRTTIASAAGATIGSDASTNPVINADQFVVSVTFESLASNFGVSPADTNGVSDIYTSTFAKTDGTQDFFNIVSVEQLGDGPLHLGNGPSWDPAVRDDGHAIAFTTAATNLLSTGPDTNGHDDIVVRTDEFPIAQFRPANLPVTGFSLVHGAGPVPNAAVGSPRFLGNSSRVVYASAATNLAPGDTATHSDLFVSDYLDATTSCLTRTPSGSEANGDSTAPSPSADGSRIAFASTASDLTAGDTNLSRDVFVHAAPGFIQRASTTLLLGAANGDSASPALSGDGSTIAFLSNAPNLETPDTNPAADVFVRAAVVPEIDSVFKLDANGQEVRPVLQTGRNDIVVHGRGFGPAVTAFLGEGVNVVTRSVAPDAVHLEAIVIEPITGPRDLSIANLAPGLGASRGSLRTCAGCINPSRQ